MHLGIFTRILFCILSVGFFLYGYINKQNGITELRLQIPNVIERLQLAEQENIRLQYEIDRFEDPLNLMEMARRPEYGHLKHPLLDQIVELQLSEKGER